MSTILLNYKLNETTVTNPDGLFELKFSDAKVVPGPGPTIAGNYPTALDLETQGKGAVEVSGLVIDRRQFTLRIVFQANGPVLARANLLESNRLPFKLFLMPRDATEFDLVASVPPLWHGWQSASTKFATGLKPGVWYVADFAYDMDTLAVFVDEVIASVHAFPSGEVEEFLGSLYVGTSVDLTQDHFNGKIAAIEWWAGIPDALQEQIDERRAHPEWFITHKVELLRQRLNLGEPVTAISLHGSGAYIQHYDRGALMYHDSAGVAFEMHGAIYEHYKTLGVTPPLGYLVNDESPSTNAAGRKSVFSKGAIYWSPATPAIAVLNQLYIDYEALGEARTLGFPTTPERATFGGVEQEFQGARMYYKTGQPNAHEVHGAILEKFLASGGVAKWGFPISNETDLRNGNQVVGKFSDFEGCTIYWSSATGAFEVHGDIKRKYDALKGPIGRLGFPTSDEQEMFGAPGARMSTFQNGVLLWYGSFDSIVIARPFRLFIQRINSRESEGVGLGQNDMYIRIKVWDGAEVVYDKRLPSSGDWSGRNIVDVNFTIPLIFTPNPAKAVTLSIDVWEADPGDDDHLGMWTTELDASNGWGLRDNNQGLLNSGAFSKINSITAAVQPVEDLASLTLQEKFWSTLNQSTDDISYQKYATAFSDVDSETEFWDISDWLDKAFYELVVKDLAENGNCVGMSLEAIYSLKGRSIFSMPLNRFTWNFVEPEVNIRHCYQVGAGPIWWYVYEFLTGNTHDPVDVFNKTRAEFNRGNNPVICIAQNYDFSGAPHCVLPVAWDSSSKPWKISICDPSVASNDQPKILTVDPDNNKFEYNGADHYSGGAWTGGRFHYMPYSLLSSVPRTPVWDAILLILSGTILILGEDAETVSLTDGDGRDINGHGDRARELLQHGETLSGFFVPVKGYKGKGIIKGEILMRRRLSGNNHVVGTAGIDLSELAHLPLEKLTATRTFRTIHNALFGERPPSGRNASRTLYQLANDLKSMRKLSPEVRRIVETAARAALPGDFRHSVVGLRNGKFGYGIKHGLSEFRLDSSLTLSERVDLAVDRLGTSSNAVTLKTGRDKLMRLEIANKLGVAGDHVRIAVEQLPVSNAAPLHLNIKPGIGGLDVVTGGRAEARIEVNALIDKKQIRRSFQLPLEGGARLKLSNVLSQRTLSVSRIDRLLAPGRDVKIITSSD
jgi:hypothetical protein